MRRSLADAMPLTTNREGRSIMATQNIAPMPRGRRPRAMLPMPSGIKQTVVKGRRYFYHRATKTALKSRPTDPVAFLAEIAQLDGATGAAPKRKIERRTPHGSCSWGALVEAYRHSAKYLTKRERTKADYEKVLGYLSELNAMPLIQFDAAACEKIRDKALEQKGRRFATYIVQILSLVLGWGKRHPEFGRYENGAVGLEKFKSAGDANRPWTDDEQRIVISEATGSLLNAIALGMFASMRGGDIVRTEWSAYNGTAIQWQAGKNDLPVWKPARRALREILDAAPRIGKWMVCGPDGGQWTEGTLRKNFRTLIARLENEKRVAKGITLHGLRTTNATRLADLGADVRAIQAELGDRSTAMGFHYSRNADMKRAAETAARLLDDER